MNAMNITPGFTMTPLGPRNDTDGRWCCGLHCGQPCPYHLKIKPRGLSTMTNTLPGIQVTNRCAAYDGQRLCGDPAPYLVNGTSLCPDHAITYAQFVMETVNGGQP